MQKKPLSKERLVAIALFGYAFPYATLAMMMDFRSGSLKLWGFLLIALIIGVLALTIRVYGSAYWILAGNAVSFLMSYGFMGIMSNSSSWMVFFKPFDPQEALFLYAGLLLIPQAAVLVGAEVWRRARRFGSH